MTRPIPYPRTVPRATPLSPPPLEGRLAILRNLFLRASVTGGKLTTHEISMGIESVQGIEAELDERHAERLKGHGHD
jgi:hypothetical protein